ncbi:hypothetical protein [Staphylococcus phage vB_StaM_SA1]|nr:hypothetical protein [Staphylococcus phage vB_StaM_SA1]
MESIFFLFVFLFILSLIILFGILAFIVPLEMLDALSDIERADHYTINEKIFQVIVLILGFPFFGVLTVLLFYFNFAFIMYKI